jgi:hypothetical protein
MCKLIFSLEHTRTNVKSKSSIVILSTKSGRGGRAPGGGHPALHAGATQHRQPPCCL